MPIVRDWPDVRRVIRAGQFMPRFITAEILSVNFLTDPKTVAAVLPRPLRYFGVTYHEGALFIAAGRLLGRYRWPCCSGWSLR